VAFITTIAESSFQYTHRTESGCRQWHPKDLERDQRELMVRAASPIQGEYASRYGHGAAELRMNIRLVRAVFLFVLAMSPAFALRETLMVLGL
jgi:hypothetical protein